MKKSLMVGAAVAAMAITSSASALNAAGYSNAHPSIVSDGLGSLGVVRTIMALGVSGPNACHYRMIWQDPFNPNNTRVCELYEGIGVVNSDCNVNKTTGFQTGVLAGSVAGSLLPSGSTACDGFDLTGTPWSGINLILTETAGSGGPGSISGMALFPVASGIGVLPFAA